MHYYQYNIADYRKDTQHLTPIEHYIYRELMDMYYLDEDPIAKKTDWVLRRLRLGSESVTELEYVLREFFTESDDGWVHGRIEREIKKWNSRGWFPGDKNVVSLRPSIDEWKETRRRIFERDKFTCAYCGEIGGELECDHIHPVSRGGSNDDANLTTACRKCNRDKSNKTVSEWRG